MSIDKGGGDVRWNRTIEIAIGIFFGCYLVYTLMLGKLFSPSIAPPWFRDLGILWDLSDYVFQHLRYQIGAYFFPPPNAILARLFGLIGHEFAFRIFLLLQAVSFIVTLWSWSVLIGISKQANRLTIVLVAFLAVSAFVKIEFHMHNLNLVTLALLSIAMLFQRSTVLSAACFSLSLALKPYGSILFLPWMAWQGRLRWTVASMVGLLLLFAVLPILVFGPTVTWRLYQDWIASLLTTTNSAGDHPISIQAGIAFVASAELKNPTVGYTSFALQAIYLGAVVAFFLPTVFRRQVATGFVMASEVAALLLTPLPLGGHQQPARAVVLIGATLVMTSALFDKRRTLFTRVVLAVLLAAIGISTHVVPLGPLYFLLTLPVCLVTLAGLAIARRAPMSEAVAGEGQH